MTRRLQHISDPSWQPLLLVAEFGAVVIFLGILCQIAQLYVSIRTREQRRGLAPVQPSYEPIEAPRNSPIGLVTAFFASVTGFALIWHIWWMAILGLAGVFIAILAFGWSDDRERELSATDIEQLERARLGQRQPA